MQYTKETQTTRDLCRKVVNKVIMFMLRGGWDGREVANNDSIGDISVMEYIVAKTSLLNDLVRDPKWRNAVTIQNWFFPNRPELRKLNDNGGLASQLPAEFFDGVISHYQSQHKRNTKLLEKHPHRNRRINPLLRKGEVVREDDTPIQVYLKLNSEQQGEYVWGRNYDYSVDGILWKLFPFISAVHADTRCNLVDSVRQYFSEMYHTLASEDQDAKVKVKTKTEEEKQ